MTVDAGTRQRRSIRLRHYEYSQAGAYFVTICARNRGLLFEDASIRRIAKECWLALPDHFPHVELDEWVVMPNHLHGILVIEENDAGGDVGNRSRGVQLNAPTGDSLTRDTTTPHSMISLHRGTLAVLVRTYKAAVTTLCRKAEHDFGWQRIYYEHILRDEADLARVLQYIRDNPLQWELDEYHPSRMRNSVAL